MQQTGIYALIERNALDHPDAPALLRRGGDPLSYGALANLIRNSCAQLRSCGVGPHDRVAYMTADPALSAGIFLSVASCAVAAPLNPALPSEALATIFDSLKPNALLADSLSFATLVAPAERLGIPILEATLRAEDETGAFEIRMRKSNNLPNPVHSEISDAALLLHTSGTTSRPKLVPLTHANLCAGASNTADSLNLAANDRCLNLMPLFHIPALVAGLLAPIHAGGCVACCPTKQIGDFWNWMKEFQPTWFLAVPAIHQMILEDAGDAPPRRNGATRTSLRFIRSSSAPMPARVARELESLFGVPFIEAYGMTEASHQIACNPLPPGNRKPGTVGTATGTEIVIMDSSGNFVERGKIGEVTIRGANLMSGYAGNSEANSEAFIRGWFRTGDEGFLDDEGYLTLTGRIKEIVNRGGEKISPREVDTVLLDHPAVGQAVAFGIPHSRLGEDLVAAVVLKKGCAATEEEIRRFAAQRLADYKIPGQILFVSEIPRGATGKIQRTGLGAKLEHLLTPEYVPPTAPLERWLADIWHDVLSVRQVGIHDNFFRLGGHSLPAGRIVARIGDALGVEISANDFFRHLTVARLAEFIAQDRLTPEAMKKLEKMLDDVESLSDDEVKRQIHG